MTNFKEAFGKNLKQIRKHRDITQEALAEMVGIHPRQVSKIETGDHFPNCTTLENICIALEVSPKELFNFEMQEITENTGTGNKYTYKALVKGNIIYLDNQNFRKQKVEKINSATEIDTKMLNLAKKTGKPITVQYYHNKEVSKIIEYHPDGTYKILKENTENICNALLENIKHEIIDKGKLEYFKLALDALNNNKDLEKLELLLSGIKMGRV
ncbi:helix-turn-helix transcriptional regulator [bacterium]|nr:helix-turn-helix transcriptional regulator [bacterium]